VDSHRELTVPDGDPDREYGEAEKERLSTSLLAVATEVHRGDHLGSPLDLSFLQYLHARLFDGVRSHAGRHRTRGRGSEHLVFGPNHSVHRDEVEAQLGTVFDFLARSLRSFDANPDDPAYDLKAIHIAAWVHAEVVRIHPFEDGNGRAGRLLMQAILVRLGLRPIQVEACRQEYIDALNRYYQEKDIGLLLDLLIRLYPAP
jgi:Fic family protein